VTREWTLIVKKTAMLAKRPVLLQKEVAWMLV